MFTGIVTDVGTVLSVQREADLRARIGTAYDSGGLALGASVCCDGICLTVIARGRNGRDWFDVQISAETVSRTSLARRPWQAGTRINLERALRVGDELGGHIVSGHVDGVASVTRLRDEGASTRFTFRAPAGLARFIAPKGSVALNGTSLTVNEVEGPLFGVNIIPHTKAVTTWGSVRVGDEVNLEVDTLARYVARLHDWTAVE
ncbi:MAG: riboflavin synthase [Pseudomonadota bacterium]